MGAIDSWYWNASEFKIHCDSVDERDVVLSNIPNSRESGVYTIPGQNREFDVIIPSKYVKLAKWGITSLRSKKVQKMR